MKKRNSQGFAAIEALLIVVIIAAIAGVGYYVYNSQKKTNTTLDNAAKSQSEPQKAEKKAEATTAPAQKDPNTGYLVIKEWGVRIKQPESPVSYTLEPVDGNGAQSAVLINADVRALTGFNDNCNFVILERVVTPPSPEVLNPDQLKKIGDYYFYSGGAQDACSTSNKEEAVKKVLFAAADTVEPKQ